MKPRENPITPQFIRNNPLSEFTASVVKDYISGEIGAGEAVEKILSVDNLSANDKRAVIALMRMCVRIDQRKGLVAVLRSDAMRNAYSEARKQMFFIDFLNNSMVFS